MTLSEYDREHLEDLIFGEGTWFTAHLIRLIMKADSSNFERLRLGFPEEVAAVEIWREGPGVDHNEEAAR